MKHYYALTLLLLCCFLKWNNASAQTISSKIIDATVDYDSVSSHYMLYVFLTDTFGFNGLDATIGSNPGSSDLYDSGTLSKGSVAIQEDNIINYDLGGISLPSSYYLTAKVLLINSTNNMIDITNR